MLLNVELAGALPGVVREGEEDGLGADAGGDGLDGSGLLRDTGDGGAVGVTGVGPAGLEVDDVLSTADLLELLELALGELTGLGGGDIGVEEGVDVGTDDVDGAAESGRAVLLPDVDGLGGGDQTGVAGGLEASGGGLDEGGQGGSVDVSGLDGLVTDNDQLDHGPLGPGDDLGDLLLGGGDTGAVNVDTHDDVDAEGLAGLADVLQTAAVSGVDTDQVEALALDGGEVGENGGLGLAVTSGGVGGVSHTVLALTEDGGDTSGLGGGGGGGRAGGGAGGADNGSSAHADGNNRSDSAGADDGDGSGSGSGSGRHNGGGGRGQGVGGSRADVGVISAGHGDGGLILSVGTGDNGLGGRVDQNGAGRHRGGGRGHNGVGTSRGADVGGGLNHAGHGAAGGLDGGIGAGDCSGSLDNGGNTTVGDGTAGDLSGGGTADGGGVPDGDGGGRDGVDTSGGEGAHTGSGQHNGRGASDAGGSEGANSWHRGRSRLCANTRDGDGQSAGAGGLHSAGVSAGLGDSDGSRGGRGNSNSLSRDRGSSGNNRLVDQGSGAVDGDNLGGATTGLLGLSRGRGPGADSSLATLVESIMATVNAIGHGRPDQGGGENSSLHYGWIIQPRKKNECPLNE